MTKNEALKLALESLERIDLWLKARYSGIGLVGVELDALTAIKEALAQPAQEPIGYAVPTFDFDNSVIKKVQYARTVPLYTDPPQRSWVGLTEEDLKPLCAEWRIVYGAWMDDFARDIEAKLKEKNT